MNDLKQRIFDNPFCNEVRDGEIPNSQKFDDLCQALVELAAQWKLKTMIDKDLVADLFSQYAVIYGNLLSYNDATQQEREMVFKLESLICDCLR